MSLLKAFPKLLIPTVIFRTGTGGNIDASIALVHPSKPEIVHELQEGEGSEFGYLIDSGQLYSFEPKTLRETEQAWRDAGISQSNFHDTVSFFQYQKVKAFLEDGGIRSISLVDDEFYVQQLIKGLNDATLTIPESLTVVLYPYQQEALKWLEFCHHHQLGCLLADDMGLGKTPTAIALLASVQPTFLPCLVICPATVLENWLREFGKPWLVPILRLALGQATIEQLERYYDMFKTLKDNGLLKGTVFRDAPAVILAYDLKTNRMGALNCAIAMRNVEVMAMTMGLGTCWTGFLISAAHFRPGKINALVGIGPNDRIHGALMLGHPKYTYNVKLPRRARAVKIID